MSNTASEYLDEAIEKTGVKRVYGVVGDSLNGFTDARGEESRSTGFTCGVKRLPLLRR